jgi:hypothetical protein
VLIFRELLQKALTMLDFQEVLLFRFILLNKFVEELYFKKSEIISGVLTLLNEYTEENGNFIYKNGINYFEEMLYHLEQLSKAFSVSDAKLYIKITDNLLK